NGKYHGEAIARHILTKKQSPLES
ncbi:thioredoxin reductase, partial [Staphylococcus pseudintermedius]